MSYVGKWRAISRKPPPPLEYSQAISFWSTKTFHFCVWTQLWLGNAHRVHKSSNWASLFSSISFLYTISGRVSCFVLEMSTSNRGAYMPLACEQSHISNKRIRIFKPRVEEKFLSKWFMAHFYKKSKSLPLGVRFGKMPSQLDINRNKKVFCRHFYIRCFYSAQSLS